MQKYNFTYKLHSHVKIRYKSYTVLRTYCCFYAYALLRYFAFFRLLDRVAERSKGSNCFYITEPCIDFCTFVDVRIVWPVLPYTVYYRIGRLNVVFFVIIWRYPLHVIIVDFQPLQWLTPIIGNRVTIKKNTHTHAI